MRRVGVALGIVALILAGTPSIVGANTGAGGTRTELENVDDDADDEVTNEVSDSQSGYQEGASVDDPCDYEVGVEDDLVNGVWDFSQAKPITISLDDLLDEERRVPIDYGTTRIYSETGRWFNQTCPDSEILFGEPVGELVPEGSATTIGALISRSIGVLDPPEPTVTVLPEGKQLVQFPSLFWVEPTYWETVRADTQTAGRVSSTVDLVPTFSVWDPGDGSYPVECEGPGEVWERGVDADDFYCQYTYKTVEGQPFPFTATVQFEVEVAATIGGAPAPESLGPYEFLERTTEIELGVREIQVVETNG